MVHSSESRFDAAIESAALVVHLFFADFVFVGIIIAARGFNFPFNEANLLVAALSLPATVAYAFIHARLLRLAAYVLVIAAICAWLWPWSRGSEVGLGEELVYLILSCSLLNVPLVAAIRSAGREYVVLGLYIVFAVLALMSLAGAFR